jgi:hypothetical protein
VKPEQESREIEFVRGIGTAKIEDTLYESTVHLLKKKKNRTLPIVLTFVDTLQEIQYQRHFEYNWIDRLPNTESA